MKDPTLSLLVTAAAAVSVVQHSSTGSVLRPRDTKWSHDQTPLKPAASMWRADSSHHSDVTPIEVGLTPKHYCRIRRFQRAVTLANCGRHVDWPQVALDCGYFDQAHFINDFRSFSGLTPTRYLAARTPFQNHVKFLQSDADGV